MTSLEGRVIAITGAASGIALATAHLLASRGASISIADIRQEPLEAAVADIKKSNPTVKIYAKAVDVKYGQEVGDWLDETIKHLGPLSGAANLAGVLSFGKQIVVRTFWRVSSRSHNKTCVARHYPGAEPSFYHRDLIHNLGFWFRRSNADAEMCVGHER